MPRDCIPRRRRRRRRRHRRRRHSARLASASSQMRSLSPVGFLARILAARLTRRLDIR